MADTVTLLARDGRTLHFDAHYQPRWRDASHCDGVIVHAVDITEQVERQRALADSETRFRRLAEASSAIILHIENDGSVAFEFGWGGFVGLQRAARRVRDLLWAVHPADRRRALRLMARVRVGGRTRESELRLRHGKNAFRHVALRVVGLPDAQAEADHYSACQWIVGIRDIHDRRQALDDLERAKDELRLILDTMPARIAYVQPDRRLRWVNRAFREWNLQSGPPRGLRIDEVLPADATAALEAGLLQAMAGRAAQVEWPQAHPALGPRWVFATVSPDADAYGRVQGCVVMCFDHTERKQIERELLQRTQEYMALAESTPHLVWIADAAGAIVYFNRRWSDYTGLRLHDDWTVAFHPDDRAAVIERFAAAIEQGEEFTAEVRLLGAAGGTYRWHVLRAVPVGNDDESRRWYGGFTDIEDQKQAQDVLLRAQSKTQAFLATLSHELRNPLAVLSTNAYLLAEGRDADAKGELARAIQRQTQQLHRMVDDLLDISRITQGKIQLRIEPCDLNDLVSAVCEDFAERARAQGTQLHCRRADYPVPLHADVARVRQIADNLVTNALKATVNGGNVYVSVRIENRQRVLSVRDEGHGIPPAVVARMFEPFVQDAGWRDRGLGLGLAVVSQLTGLHGGEVRAYNEIGGGAVFEVRLPPGKMPIPAPVDKRSEPVAGGNGAKVLVVDDVVDHANALAALLRASGFEAVAVYSGDAAVGYAQTQRVDAVICDIGLPEPWNGHRVAEFLRRQWGSTPVLIAYSGLGAASDVAAALAAGFDAHLLKPTRPAEILARVRDGLAERQREPARV